MGTRRTPELSLVMLVLPRWIFQGLRILWTLPPVATAEKVNQRNKNTLVWLRAPRTLVLDELLPAALSAPSAATELLPQSAAAAGVPAALSVSSAATELLPQSAATAEVQPASGSNLARLPFASIEPVRGPHPAWLGRWILFEQALAKEAQEWEWVTVEDEEKEKVVPKVNSKPETEHVTNLAMLARLHRLEESNLMYWIFEFGEEEGLMRAIDELRDRFNFETESVASEVPWKGEVLQVHLQVSRQPTKKEEVCFLFRGSGGGLGMQRVHGGSSLTEWYLGLQGMASGGMLMATSPPLVGGFWTLRGRLLVLVWLGCKRWFSMEGFGAGRLVVLARRWRSLILESGSVHFVVLPTVGTLACRAIGVGPIGIGSLAVQALGALLVVKVVGMGSRREWLVRGLVGGGGFIGQGGVGVCYGRGTVVRPNWS